MGKTELPIRPIMYAMPVVVIGSTLGTTINYMTAAYCGIINHRPPMLYVSLTKGHATTQAILEHHCFSVSVPTSEQLVSVDYCGITSGNNADKSEIFPTFLAEPVHQCQKILHLISNVLSLMYWTTMEMTKFL